jgi:transposase
MENADKARERLSVVMRVLSGQLSVTEAAATLGISRKSYYEWQERALAGMQEALTNRPAGRKPAPVDAEKEQLREQVRTLSDELDLARKTIEVKNILAAFEARRKSLLSGSAMPGKKKRM